MSLLKRLTALLSPTDRGTSDESEAALQEEVDRIAESVAPLRVDEEMDWGEPSARTGKAPSQEDMKAVAIAELQKILDSIPRPAGASPDPHRDRVRAADAARAVLASIGHAGEPAPRAGRPDRQALIDEAMGNWARGHDILSRMDPSVRKKIRTLADEMLPD